MGDGSKVVGWFRPSIAIATIRNTAQNIESLHSNLLKTNRQLRNRFEIPVAERSSAVEELQLFSRTLTEELEKFDFNLITPEMDLTGPHIPLSSPIWSNSLGAFIRLIQLYSASGGNIDESELRALYEIAGKSDNPQVQLLFSEMVGGTPDNFKNSSSNSEVEAVYNTALYGFDTRYITRYGGDTTYSDDYTASLLAGGNVCFNFYDTDKDMFCREPGTFDPSYDSTETVKIPHGKLPAIDGSVKQKFSELPNSFSLFGENRSPAEILTMMRNNIENMTLFSDLAVGLFSNVIHPETALVYFLSIYNIVTMSNSLDRQTKQLYGHIAARAVSEIYVRNFNLFRREEMKNVGECIETAIQEDECPAVEDMVRLIQADLYSGLQVAEETGKWLQGELCMDAKCPELKTVINCNGDDCSGKDLGTEWQKLFVRKVLPSGDEESFNRFVSAEEPSVNPEVTAYGHEYLKHLYHIWRDQDVADSLNLRQTLVRNRFQEKNMDIYDAFHAGSGSGWSGTAAFIGGMVTSGMRGFGSAGGGLTALMAVETGTRVDDAIETVEKRDPLSLGLLYRLDNQFGKDNKTELSAADSDADGYISFAGIENAKAGLKEHYSNLYPGVCVTASLSALYASGKLWQLAHADGDLAVRNFYTGIDADGDFIDNSSPRLGNNILPAGLTLASLGAAAYCINRRFTSGTPDQETNKAPDSRPVVVSDPLDGVPSASPRWSDAAWAGVFGILFLATGAALVLTKHPAFAAPTAMAGGAFLLSMDDFKDSVPLPL